jgi:signal peptidase II
VRAGSAWARAALLVGGVVAADQLSKRAVNASIAPGDTRNVLPGLQLTHTRNHGVAFGFLPGNHAIVVAIIGAALLAVLIYFARHTSRPLVWLPTGLLIGGALGNILDRVRDGSVTDFIKLPLGWPPFNLADVAITVGVLSLFYVIEEGGHGDRDERPAPDDRRLSAPVSGRPE